MIQAVDQVLLVLKLRKLLVTAHLMDAFIVSSRLELALAWSRRMHRSLQDAAHAAELIGEGEHPRIGHNLCPIG